jgi:hypothetical protein
MPPNHPPQARFPSAPTPGFSVSVQTRKLNAERTERTPSTSRSVGRRHPSSTCPCITRLAPCRRVLAAPDARLSRGRNMIPQCWLGRHTQPPEWSTGFSSAVFGRHHRGCELLEFRPLPATRGDRRRQLISAPREVSNVGPPAGRTAARSWEHQVRFRGPPDKRDPFIQAKSAQRTERKYPQRDSRTGAGPLPTSPTFRTLTRARPSGRRPRKRSRRSRRHRKPGSPPHASPGSRFRSLATGPRSTRDSSGTNCARRRSCVSNMTGRTRCVLPPVPKRRREYRYLQSCSNPSRPIEGSSWPAPSWHLSPYVADMQQTAAPRAQPVYWAKASR